MLIVVGIILRIMFDSFGVAIFLVSAMFILSFYYLVIGYRILLNRFHNKEFRFLSFAICLFIFLGLLGVLFQTYFWPFTKKILWISSISSVLTVLVWSLRKFENKTEFRVFKNMKLRILVVMIPVFIFAVTPNKTLIKFFYWKNQERAEQISEWLDEYDRYGIN